MAAASASDEPGAEPGLPAVSPGLPGVSGELRMLLEYSLDVLTVLDADGTWRYSSPAGTQLLGHQPGYDPEGGIFSLLHPDDLGVAIEAFGLLATDSWDSSPRGRAADPRGRRELPRHGDVRPQPV